MLLFCDSFPYTETELMACKKWSLAVSSAGGRLAVNAATNGPYGGKDRYINVNGDCYCTLNLGPNYNEATVMFQCTYNKASLGTQTARVVTFSDNGTEQCALWYVNGTLVAKLANGTVLGTATANLTAAWTDLQVKVTIDPSAGLFLVKQNNETVINFSGATRSTANSRTNWFQLGGGAGWQYIQYFSNVLFMDTQQVGGQNYCNDLLGPRRVQQCIPTADGNYKQWTRSTGANNYANIDEVGPSETDYNYTATVNNIDTFAIPDVVDAGATKIDAINCSIYGKILDAGLAKVKGAVRSNSVDGVGTEVTLPASSAYLSSVIYTDPNTSAPFTVAGFNAAEFGYKRSA